MAEELATKQSKKRSPDPSEEEPETKKVAPSADGNWNVDEVRGDHESVEHWELRKDFLVQNMERFPNRNRLICLSQVFANMEFLGCRYPEETMELVRECSLGIVESYREKQKTRLQRTFVKASDAAERKTKGSNSKSRQSHFVPSTHSTSPTTAKSKLINQRDAVDRKPKAPEDDAGVWPGADWDSELSRLILLIFPYDVGENAVKILHTSCDAAHIPASFECNGSFGNYTCTYKIGTSISVTSTFKDLTKESAKLETAKLVFEKLQKQCYTFITKSRVPLNFDGKEIMKDEIEGDNKTTTVKLSDPKIPESNIGNKLLKLMGWSGGGLGKDEQGIHEAISANGVVGRSKLGLGSSVSVINKIKQLLQQHKRAGFPYDLKFSSDFSKDERKDIHEVAKRLGLNSKSYGKGDGRYIVVSEKVKRNNLIQTTLAEGGETDRYKVIQPSGDLGEFRYIIDGGEAPT